MVTRRARRWLRGDDVLIGGGGNDILLGGAGADRAVFSGNRGNYVIAYDAAARILTVTDARNGAPDGSDAVHGIGALQFADMMLAAAQLSQTSDHADGSHSVVAWDAAEQQPWRDIVTDYDPRWRRTGETVRYDNGTSVTTVFDAPDAFDWASLRTAKDAAGNVRYQLGINNGGGTWATEYDLAGAQSWAKRMTVHNAGRSARGNVARAARGPFAMVAPNNRHNPRPQIQAAKIAA